MRLIQCLDCGRLVEVLNRNACSKCGSKVITYSILIPNGMTLEKQVDDIQFRLHECVERATLFNYSIITIEKLKLAQRLLTSIKKQVLEDLKENHGKVKVEESQETD